MSIFVSYSNPLFSPHHQMTLVCRLEAHRSCPWLWSWLSGLSLNTRNILVSVVTSVSFFSSEFFNPWITISSINYPPDSVPVQLTSLDELPSTLRYDTSEVTLEQLVSAYG